LENAFGVQPSGCHGHQHAEAGTLTDSRSFAKRLSKHALSRIPASLAAICFAGTCVAAEPAQLAVSPPTNQLALAVFDVDATPPIGSMLAYDSVTNHWELGLRARGLVLIGAGPPIVLCAVDWIGIANDAHDEFRSRLAVVAGTTADRVAVHALHQHDAPDCDFSAERILREAKVEPRQFESAFQRRTLSELERAVRDAVRRPQPLTHVGYGVARVEQVASNRRIPGPDGKIRAVRYTACRDAALRAEPEGTIDPEVSVVSFWKGDRPLAVLSYYATHPQSYYRTGVPNPDFPGLARFFRQLAVPAALHVHFTGAGGNIGAGKYNDGSPENRVLLAQRLADGMRRAWEATQREPVTPATVGWDSLPVALPPAKDLDETRLMEQLSNGDSRFFTIGGPTRLAWIRRCLAGHRIDISCLRLGRARILHMPGELFVEYQLAAKAERPDLFVAMAAYGDYGPWYIGTARAYEEGGYETTPPASNVSPEAERELLEAMRKLLAR